jgi:hypothetical protein
MSTPEQPQQQQEFKKGVTILVATPCYGGQIFQGYMHSVLALQRICDKIGWNLVVKTHGNESLIPRGRNLYVAMTLGIPQITHLLYIDADITFQPESVVRMIQEDRDITGGIYAKKGVNFAKIRDLAVKNPDMDPAKLEHIAYDYVINVEGGNIPIQKGFIKCKYIGTGMMLIKRQVLEKMVEAYPETKYNNDIAGYNAPELVDNFYALFDCIIHPESKRYLSEDYLFCERWSKIGGEIWADITAELVHTGTHSFSGSFLQHIMHQAQIIPDASQQPKVEDVKKVEEVVQPVKVEEKKKEKVKFVNSI